MNLLVAVSNYPHAGHIYSGIFNERSVRALKQLGHQVDVLAPRPYVPQSLSRLNFRWKAYGQISEHESRDGVEILRPRYLQPPFIGGGFWLDSGAYLCCARKIDRKHRHKPYDAILSFNLLGAGGLAWRLGGRLGIPAAGWATGNDVRVSSRSSQGRVVRKALDRLDVVFYQSAELLEKAAGLSGLAIDAMAAERHIVLPRGIEPPPELSARARRRWRRELGVSDDQVLIVYVGRIVKPKGVFDLIEAVAAASRRRQGIVCLLIGAKPGFDDADRLREKLTAMREAAQNIRLVPECPPRRVWRYLHAADIFAFPSHNEGMPNSLLEAMAIGRPAVVYAVPPMFEIDKGSGALKMVRPFDVKELSLKLSELAESPEQRRAIGKKAAERALTHFMARDKMAEAMRKLTTIVGKSGSAARSALIDQTA